ncbi:efflux RND transporter periplasmic adaptor subunit [Sphingomonas qilianensis]|uniref:HlyD family efflux transporter periplasmic adaptor subunit n=1 Tax=Sphingomonas qilianensis TaxID=1736690 RepID=A0ABU9XTT5_9SPHN
MKMRLSGPTIIGILVALVVGLALFFATRPAVLEVELARVTRGPMRVTVNDLAETRVHDLYTVSAPVAGQMLRVPLKPGATVIAHRTLLAQILPVEVGPLDARTLAQTKSTVAALAAQASATRAEVQQSLAALNLVERQLARAAQLRAHGFVAQAALDQARAEKDRALAATAAARDEAAAARHSLDAARAALIVPGSAARGRGVVSVVAPVSGTVLTVPQESARVVTAGMPLVAIGDPAQLEMVTDLLSADAVEVRPGATVSIEDWGGAEPLIGRVRLVEPYGFLKVSALGVEEQRVNVVIDFAEPRTAWRLLGHGFRAAVRITVWSAKDAVRIPISALFRTGNAWQTFKVERGRARAVTVALGRMNDNVAQVIAGVRSGDDVIVHPGDKVRAGSKVRRRAVSPIEESNAVN